MSEKVKITIVIETEKGIEQKREVTHEFGATLMSTLQKMNLISESFCGGIGKCGRCRVQFLQGAPLPTPLERSTFSPEELRAGYRLACMVKPKNSCVIRSAFVKSDKMDIITEVMNLSETNDLFSQPKSVIYEDVKMKKKVRYIVSVDLGTTTIAMQLQELYSGKIIATYCEINPQRKFGADVLSRIRAAEMGHAEEMKESVWQVFRTGLTFFEKKLEQMCDKETGDAQAECRQPIACISIAGNTTMEHLFMGLPVEALGRSPFTPVEIGLQKTEFQGIPVYVTPGISTFVGGDIVAGLYYCGLLEFLSQIPSEVTKQHDTILFLDLGTNGEMALTDGKQMLVTATAAGPAFEGGAGAAVPGSDMVAVIASLLKKGIIDETGLLQEPYFSEGIIISLSDEARQTNVHQEVSQIYITQKDIRDIQMAKAAVCAGVEILWEKMGKPSIKKVYLAGGFGYYLDVEAALAVGLLPERILSGQKIVEEIKAVGNTSLAGAFQLSRDLWTGRLREPELQRLQQQVMNQSLMQQEEKRKQESFVIESINLAKQEKFQEIYLRNLNFKI
ncbi:MAG: DUF4445 domain-containing protein [Lachnospiraceae bacterium]|nr:DUF4445 domain-containing protein [Lachnospiraceae bacterium]